MKKAIQEEASTTQQNNQTSVNCASITLSSGVQQATIRVATVAMNLKLVQEHQCAQMNSSS